MLIRPSTNNLFTRFQSSSFNSFFRCADKISSIFFLRAITQERHITLTKQKKTCISYFFMRIPYMKIKNSSMHSSKVRLSIKVCNVKMPKMTKGHNSRSTFQNLFKGYSGHLLNTTNLLLKFQGSSFNSF